MFLKVGTVLERNVRVHPSGLVCHNKPVRGAKTNNLASTGLTSGHAIFTE